MANSNQEILLSKIKEKVYNINKLLCDSNNAVANSCANPNFVSLCELQQILDKLDEIKIQINGDDIQINLNLDELEALITTTNNLLSNLTNNTVQYGIYGQLDATGNYTGNVVGVTKTYDKNGVLLSTVYTDSVTGLVTTLSPSTQQLAPVTGLFTNIVELCDDNGKFLRHFIYFPSGVAFTYNDTDLSNNPYTPVGTVGDCCKKEIFATHDRYISVLGIPPNFVAYEMTSDLTTQGLDASNSYFHLIYPTLNGSSGLPIGTQLTEYFSNIQDGILWTDIAGVQAVIDFVLPSMGLSIGDVIYAVNTSNLPIFFLSPTAVTELANNTYLHIYWGPIATHNTYNEKADVNVLAINPNILLGGTSKCVAIQEIKERNSCTGEETYRYVVENGAGILVDASTTIAGWDETNIKVSCIEPPVVVQYNNVKQQEATFGNPITISANTVHSISYKILEGNVDITIGADTLVYIQGEADMEEADELIIQQYTFTPQVGGKVKIKTIY